MLAFENVVKFRWVVVRKFTAKHSALGFEIYTKFLISFIYKNPKITKTLYT